MRPPYPSPVRRALTLALRYTPVLRTAAKRWAAHRARRCREPDPLDPYRSAWGCRDIVREEIELFDAARNSRLPCLVTRPAALTEPAPVILYSVPMDWDVRQPTAWGHMLADTAAAAGYFVVNIRHPDSDRLIVPRMIAEVEDRNTYIYERFRSFEDHHQRYGDPSFVIDSLEQWNRAGPWAGLLDPSRIGMSGHSFGGVTALMLAGQRWPPDYRSYKDDRIKAVVAYSGIWIESGIATDAFSRLDIPALIVTGSEDFAQDHPRLPEDKLWPFLKATAAEQYALLLEGADHHTYTGVRAERGHATPRERVCHQWIRSIGVAFWDAYLRDDASARDWLRREVPGALGGDGALWMR